MILRIGLCLVALTVAVLPGCGSAPPAAAEEVAPVPKSPPTPVVATPTPAAATPAAERAPEVVTPPPRATLVAGYDHTCALVTAPGSSDPRIKCWGANAYGELGLGDTKERGAKKRQMGDALPFVALPDGPPILSLAAAHHRTCALRANGTLYCWGYNEGGELGLGDEVSRGGKRGDIAALPAIDLPGPVVSMALGEMHACAVIEGGGVACWGNNYDGRLGLGDRDPRGAAPGQLGAALPLVALGTGLRARAVSLGAAHTCALFTNDATLVKCWGSGSLGQLGRTDIDDRGHDPAHMGDVLPRVELGADFRITTIAAGHSHTCALSRDHRLKCWGHNRSGQLGQGHRDSPGQKPGQSPIPATMGSDLPFIDLGRDLEVTAVATGNSHSCAIVRRKSGDSGVKCWGSGAIGLGPTGEIGGRLGEMGDALPFVDLGTDLVPVALALSSHSCVLLLDRAGPDTAGRVKCWGRNSHGNLGRGDTELHTEHLDEMGDALPFVDLGTDVRVVVPPHD